MTRTVTLALAALATVALVSGASALPQQFGPMQPPAKSLQNLQNKPLKIQPINPNQLKLAQPFKPVQPVPPIVVPNPPKVKPFYPHWKQPLYVQPVVEQVYIVGQNNPRPAPRPAMQQAAPKTAANCLTKDITAEGLVIFRDLCTNEVATTVIPGTPAAAAAEAAQKTAMMPEAAPATQAK